MDPFQVSAQFAAYVWYSHQAPAGADAEASAYAQSNWNAFLPLAHEGLGRLLVKMAGTQKTRSTKARRRRFNPNLLRPVAGRLMRHARRFVK